jgi:Ser/Thr protein kinase RdoA (MazF antagonist)
LQLRISTPVAPTFVRNLQTDMVDNPYDVNLVLAAYPPDCRPISGELRPVLGGFSGSRIWRLEAARGPLCLRLYPDEHPTADRLRWIHWVLRGVVHQGLTFVLLPISTCSGERFVEHGGHLWELSPWLPGEPVHLRFAHSAAEPQHIRSAMAALARFHHAVSGHSRSGYCLGILERLQQLKQWRSGGLEQLTLQIDANRARWPELAERSPKVLSQFNDLAPQAVDSVHKVIGRRVPIHPCIRDIHRDHILFQEDKVTGLIDFGAMDNDNISCDIARLLRSMAGDVNSFWQDGLAAFERVYPLSDDERLLVGAYDESGILLSGINWLKWVFIEDRQFADHAGVLKRFDEITCRLANLASKNRASPYDLVVKTN